MISVYKENTFNLQKIKKTNFQDFSIFIFGARGDQKKPIKTCLTLKEATDYVNNNYSSKKIILEITEKEKVFLVSENPLSHFFIDTVKLFLFLLNQNQEKKFIVYDDKRLFCNKKNKNLNKINNNTKILKNYIEDHNIDHSIIDDEIILIAKNITFYEYNINNFTVNDLKNSYEFVSNFIKDKHINPQKKVYVSRKLWDKNLKNISWIDKNQGFSWNEKYIYKDDKRVDNEEKLELYFKSLGFEIVYAENFLDIIEQINYFNSAKIIVGLTGNGLMNQLFMNNNQTIIELSTPICSSGEIAILSQYQEIANAKQHLYINIPHNRDALKIIEQIENKNLIKMLKG